VAAKVGVSRIQWLKSVAKAKAEKDRQPERVLDSVEEMFIVGVVGCSW
jgi:hypothetical protein